MKAKNIILTAGVAVAAFVAGTCFGYKKRDKITEIVNEAKNAAKEKEELAREEVAEAALGVAEEASK